MPRSSTRRLPQVWPASNGEPLVIVVGIALLDGAGRMLAAQRRHPRALAGLWEFPGGKVEGGESDQQALIRECAEELGCEVAVGAWLGATPILNGTATLRVWFGTVTAGEPHPHEHRALRWLAVDDLDDVCWIPDDLPVVAALRSAMGPSRPVTPGR